MPRCGGKQNTLLFTTNLSTICCNFMKIAILERCVHGEGKGRGLSNFGTWCRHRKHKPNPKPQLTDPSTQRADYSSHDFQTAHSVHIPKPWCSIFTGVCQLERPDFAVTPKPRLVDETVNGGDIILLLTSAPESLCTIHTHTVSHSQRSSVTSTVNTFHVSSSKANLLLLVCVSLTITGQPRNSVLIRRV